MAVVNRIPEAYLLTFTCYGSWLHGDRRGSIVRLAPGMTSSIPADSELEALSRGSLVSGPHELSAGARSLVLQAALEVCRTRGWAPLAAHVRARHVHAVVRAGDPPERVIGDIKRYATRALRRARLVPERAPVWARFGSTRYLWDWEAVEVAIRYVLDEQGSRMETFEAPPGSRNLD